MSECSEVFECRPGAAEGPLAGTYRRREPERTLLHEVVRGHLATFLAEARARSAHGFGVPWFVEQELTRYLACGILAHGFARVRCARCADEVLVAFSCKGRGVCPACGARRMHETAAHLVARVLPRVPVRQWVLAFPAAVRVHLAYDARLLGQALTIFVRALATFWRARARAHGLPVSRAGSSGAVTFVQRFGTALQLTPHFHTLVPDGTLVRRRILALLVRAGRLAAPGEEADDADASDVLPGLLAEAVRAPRRRSRGTPRLVLGPAPLTAWEDGCSLSAARLVEPNDREGLAQLCRYGIRPALALECGFLSHAPRERRVPGPSASPKTSMEAEDSLTSRPNLVAGSCCRSGRASRRCSAARRSSSRTGARASRSCAARTWSRSPRARTGASSPA